MVILLVTLHFVFWLWSYNVLFLMPLLISFLMFGHHSSSYSYQYCYPLCNSIIITGAIIKTIMFNLIAIGILMAVSVAITTLIVISSVIIEHAKASSETKALPPVNWAEPYVLRQLRVLLSRCNRELSRPRSRRLPRQLVSQL